MFKQLSSHIVSISILLSSCAAAVSQIDVVELNTQQIRDGLAKGEFSITELTQAYLDRINSFELNYNAFTALNEGALAAAADLDRELATTGPRSPLHGVPIVIKESIDVAGMPSTLGFSGFSSQAGGTDLVPSLDSPVVERLKNAGAIILGKTNIPAFSLDGTRTDGLFASWDGATYNSYDRRLAPGGSSAGTATSVSASFAVLGLGEETAGSIQYPAGAQNLVGIKPTFGLVPNTGVAPLAGSTRDVIGPIARTVFDAALALDVIAGATPEDPKTNNASERIPPDGYTALLSETALQGKRIGIYGPGWRNQSPSSETQDLYQSALEVLENQGATLVDDPFAGSQFNRLARVGFGGVDMRGFESIVFDLEQYLNRVLEPSDQSTALETLKQRTGVDLIGSDGPLGLLLNAAGVPAGSFADPDLPPDLSSFSELKRQHLDIFNQVFEENQLDALFFPQMLTQTPQLTSGSTSSPTVSEIDIMGTPGVTVPGGYYRSGAPFSVMFLGPEYSEGNLLSYSYAFEQATLHRTPPVLTYVGDIDENGKVELADFLVLQSNFGKRRSGTHRGDLNSDRRVDFKDFVLLSTNFGKGSSRQAPVPEPHDLSPAVLAVLICLRIARTRIMDEGVSRASR